MNKFKYLLRILYNSNNNTEEIKDIYMKYWDDDVAVNNSYKILENYQNYYLASLYKVFSNIIEDDNDLELLLDIKKY